MNKEAKDKIIRGCEIGAGALAIGAIIYYFGWSKGYSEAYDGLSNLVKESVKIATLPDGRVLNGKELVTELAKNGFIKTIEG